MLSSNQREYTKPIIEALEQVQTLTGHRWPRIYRDWTEIIFVSLQRDDESHGEIVDRYKSEFGEETGQSTIEAYAEGFRELLNSMKKTDGDLLGEVFEEYGPSSEKEGQFFTPENVSKFSASLNLPDEQELKDSTVNDPIRIKDPACGSGRLLIATAQLMDEKTDFPYAALYYAQDKDYTCAKMAAINFAIRGLPGIVTHGDSLTLNTRNEWKIMPSKGIMGGSIEELNSPAVASSQDDTTPASAGPQDGEKSITNRDDVDVDVTEQVQFSTFTDGGAANR